MGRTTGDVVYTGSSGIGISENPQPTISPPDYTQGSNQPHKVHQGTSQASLASGFKPLPSVHGGSPTNGSTKSENPSTTRPTYNQLLNYPRDNHTSTTETYN